eukprot:m.53799 g.53799  ORF g.53799 m.53799 type:complete len:64 (-) comp15465_c0_seq1:148-339(-)
MLSVPQHSRAATGVEWSEWSGGGVDRSVWGVRCLENAGSATAAPRMGKWQNLSAIDFKSGYLY